MGLAAPKTKTPPTAIGVSMVAYSFRSRFVDPIMVGLGLAPPHARDVPPKMHTVRAIGKKRHARPGEVVQLYTGLRTKSARLIATAVCTRTAPIMIDFSALSTTEGVVAVLIDGTLLTEKETIAFVRSDGFRTITDFVEFWYGTHDFDKLFEGIIIYWERKK